MNGNTITKRSKPNTTIQRKNAVDRPEGISSIGKVNNMLTKSDISLQSAARLSDLSEEDKSKVARLVDKILTLTKENEYLKDLMLQERQEFKSQINKLEIGLQSSNRKINETSGKCEQEVNQYRNKYGESLSLLYKYQIKLEDIILNNKEMNTIISQNNGLITNLNNKISQYESSSSQYLEKINVLKKQVDEVNLKNNELNVELSQKNAQLESYRTSQLLSDSTSSELRRQLDKVNKEIFDVKLQYKDILTLYKHEIESRNNNNTVKKLSISGNNEDIPLPGGQLSVGSFVTARNSGVCQDNSNCTSLPSKESKNMTASDYHMVDTTDTSDQDVLSLPCKPHGAIKSTPGTTTKSMTARTPNTTISTYNNSGWATDATMPWDEETETPKEKYRYRNENLRVKYRNRNKPSRSTSNHNYRNNEMIKQSTPRKSNPQPRILDHISNSNNLQEGNSTSHYISKTKICAVTPHLHSNISSSDIKKKTTTQTIDKNADRAVHYNANNNNTSSSKGTMKARLTDSDMTKRKSVTFRPEQSTDGTESYSPRNMISEFEDDDEGHQESLEKNTTIGSQNLRKGKIKQGVVYDPAFFQLLHELEMR